MTKWRRLLGNERGVALPLAMILLLVLTMLTITFMSLGAVEPQISRNLSDGARARQLAESGIEWGFSQLAGQNFTIKLSTPTPTTSGACGTGITCQVLASGQSLPGLSASSGTFTVILRNDLNTIPGDQALISTANTLDTSATGDGNGIVILSSSGTFNGASRTITAVVQRGKLDITGSLSLPGLQSDAFTNTACPSPPCPPGTLRDYSIDGRDWKRTDSVSPTGAAALKWGVQTQPGNQSNTSPLITHEENTEKGFGYGASGYTNPNDTDYYKSSYVQGKDETNLTGAAVTGFDTIEADSSGLNPTKIQSFLDNLASNSSTQIIQSTQSCAHPAGGSPHNKAEGLRMASTASPGQVTVTNNCTGPQQINQTVNLGSPTAPTMLYIKGEYDISSNFVGLAADGSQPVQGYGILVVEDADMSFFGSNFRWDGIVIVTGRYVGVGFRSNSNTEVRGALIGNEGISGEAGGFFEFLNQSTNMKIRSSQENIDMALNALFNMRITTYREN
ncbi:MAG: PilX N-terminal domain-containing pilus assembly protein [Candidatus Rokuibacteriota bacterium]